MRMLFAGLLLIAGIAGAQEGFPLDGTWRGETTAQDGSHRTIVLIMQWDGKQVAGTVDPGPGSTEFTGGKLDPDGWKFTLDAKNAKGVTMHFVGTLSELGSYRRVLTGRWTQGGSTSDIRFVRE
jgi:hypothetical protein